MPAPLSMGDSSHAIGQKCLQARSECIVVVTGDHVPGAVDVNSFGTGNEPDHFIEPSLADNV